MIPILEHPIPFGGGVRLEPHKSVSLQHGLRQSELPDRVRIPIHQHTGIPASPVVKTGERVLKGQVIARAQDYLSAPIHASISGMVTSIAEYAIPGPSGARSTCIAIESDGNDEWIKERNPIEDYEQLSPVEVQQRIFEAGIVGMGGGGFPSAVKLIPGLNLDIELLILNAVECEPYITCDEILIREYSQDVIRGFEILAHALQVDECIIAIDEDKTEAIEILKESLERVSDIEIKLKRVSGLYPAGGEKQLIKSLTGYEVPVGGLPVDIGVVCYNVGTAVAVKKAVLDAEPLISRVVTLTGPGICEAGNLEVRIGTPINEIVKQCGGYSNQFDYLIMGGPMMGYRLESDELPVIKTTNCLLAIGLETEVSRPEPSPCIRCDECERVCPVELQPQQLYWYSREYNKEKLEDYHLFDCIECGCCAYVCPSHIPLVDNYRQTKIRVWDERKKQLEAKQNKERYLAKEVRVIQQKEERRQKATSGKHEDAGSERQKKQQEIAAAVQRTKRKREKT